MTKTQPEVLRLAYGPSMRRNGLPNRLESAARI